MDPLFRYRGALLGLASGDALGTTLEVRAPGSFEPIDDIVGGGPFDLEPGQWTDDTAMALCLAESLVERRGFDAVDQLERYVRWMREGHLSSNGTCFDIGGTTLEALERFQSTGNPHSGPSRASSAGNGSLMRLAPVPLAFALKPGEAIRLAGESSRTTHGERTAVDACRFFAALLVRALFGAPKDAILSFPFVGFAAQAFDAEPLAPEIAAIAEGSYQRREPPEIRGTGYAVQSLEAALWAFHRSTSFRDGCLLAVNLGDDADTTGAIYGQLAGAYYGDTAIPAPWRERLARRAEIAVLAARLHALAMAAE